jgi:glycosyltransferase involved in cell wall biosynthesis
MNISVGMIVLNEEEFIEKNLKQHYQWSGLNVHQIIIVEGAVKLFPTRNITSDGLSTDKTAQIIQDFPDPENKITFVQGYWQDKSHQRNEYAKRILDTTDYLLVIDADEFYSKTQQKNILYFLENNRCGWHSILFPQIHLWKSFNKQVVGGYWAVPHLRLYKWQPNFHYEQNHNEIIGLDGHNYNVRDSGFIDTNEIHCIHFGFARSEKFVRDKQDFYYNRGEKTTRPMYSDCREIWFNWKPGDLLPHDAKVIPYKGEIPEVFEDEIHS